MNNLLYFYDKFIKDEEETSGDEVHVIYDGLNDHYGIDHGGKQKRIIRFR